MNNLFWQTLGSTAAVLTMFSFIPQIIKILKSKSAQDVSILTLIQLSCGVFLWMIYGIHLKDLIIIIANGITLTSLIILLILYFKYGKK